jgi:hypothetical protein
MFIRFGEYMFKIKPSEFSVAYFMSNPYHFIISVLSSAFAWILFAVPTTWALYHLILPIAITKMEELRVKDAAGSHFITFIIDTKKRPE